LSVAARKRFERIKPLLLDIGPRVTHVGEKRLALVMKIATNLSLASQMLAFPKRAAGRKRAGFRARSRWMC